MRLDSRRFVRRSVDRARRTGPPPFYNQVYDDGRVLVVTPTGELDSATVPAVAEVLDRCTGQYRAVVVNLARVSFMDSSAVSLVLAASEGPCGHHLAVVPPPDHVGRVLDHTCVRRLFRWFGSPEEALRELGVTARAGRWRVPR
jgi:anti-anti-sigma factor